MFAPLNSRTLNLDCVPEGQTTIARWPARDLSEFSIWEPRSKIPKSRRRVLRNQNDVFRILQAEIEVSWLGVILSI
jgi:hypothetical protein